MINPELPKAPKFIKRLFKEASDESNPFICWNEDGTKIRIIDKEGFIKNILQSLSKAREYSGFIRQLNIYGFVKTKGDKNDDIEEYYNTFFKKDHPNLIGFVTREPKNRYRDVRLDKDSIEKSVNYLDKCICKLNSELVEIKNRMTKQERTINGLLDILGHVFRAGAQNMGHDGHLFKVSPQLFLDENKPKNQKLKGDKKFDAQENTDDERVRDFADMGDIFF